MWTGIDYLGEAGVGAFSGVIDSAGFKKDGYYFYQSQWTTQPMLHVFPHWNWKGHEGDMLPVYCYTNCDSVELSVNGKSYGTKGYGLMLEGMRDRYGTMTNPGRSEPPATFTCSGTWPTNPARSASSARREARSLPRKKSLPQANRPPSICSWTKLRSTPMAATWPISRLRSWTTRAVWFQPPATD